MCYATATLTQDWQDLRDLRKKCDSEWLFMRLEDLTEYGEIERKYEPVLRDGRQYGFRIFYRMK